MLPACSTRSSLTSTNDFLEDSGERIDGHGLSLDPTQTLLAPSAQETLTDAFNDQDYDEFYGLLEPEEVVIVRPYGGDDDELVLAELRPRFVVMYDPDPAFVRRIEVRDHSSIEMCLAQSIWRRSRFINAPTLV